METNLGIMKGKRIKIRRIDMSQWVIRGQSHFNHLHGSICIDCISSFHILNLWWINMLNRLHLLNLKTNTWKYEFSSDLSCALNLHNSKPIFQVKLILCLFSNLFIQFPKFQVATEDQYLWQSHRTSDNHKTNSFPQTSQIKSCTP